jgi:hypothetical protein
MEEQQSLLRVPAASLHESFDQLLKTLGTFADITGWNCLVFRSMGMYVVQSPS